MNGAVRTREKKSWLPIPEEVSPADRRFFVMSQAGPAGLSMFLIGIPLFAWWGVPELVAANVLGAVVWLTGMGLSRQGRARLTAALVYLTMLTGAVLAVTFVGWQFGGQYVLVVQMLAAFLNPWSRPVSVALAAGAALLFVLLYQWSQLVPPLYAIPEPALSIAGAVNTLVTFAVACALTAQPVAAADRAEAALAAEHARSERLLTNVLPVPIARRLKDGEEPIADRVENASVLFADIVGFTPLAGRLPAEQVVTMLDGVFTRLDRLVDAHGLEKIKTIGDAYMVAAGIPTPRDDHAAALARFALEAQEQLSRAASDGGVPLQVRIGIDSGPVVAGVIGRRRLLYDLWGDTVNTASRMESHGVPGRIQITEGTRVLLGDDFVCQERGVVDVKGKGAMRTYLLDRSRSGTSAENRVPHRDQQA